MTVHDIGFHCNLIQKQNRPIEIYNIITGEVYLIIPQVKAKHVIHFGMEKQIYTDELECKHVQGHRSGGTPAIGGEVRINMTIQKLLKLVDRNRIYKPRFAQLRKSTRFYILFSGNDVGAHTNYHLFHSIGMKRCISPGDQCAPVMCNKNTLLISCKRSTHSAWS